MPPELSRRAFLYVAAHGLGAALLAGCAVDTLSHIDQSLRPAETAVAPVTQATNTPLSKNQAEALTVPLATPEVSLRVKIGQMLLLGFQGLTVDDTSPIIGDIRGNHLGGVVLFDYDGPSRSYRRNVQSPEQLKTLVDSLQQAAEIPLLVAADQEGGVVARLKPRYGFPATESHQSLGESNDSNATWMEAARMAKTLAQVGINLNLAPVVDLNINPDNPVIARYGRSFSADPETVTRHARAFVQAHHKQRVRCCLKHFPGHGSSTRDSHAGMVDITDTWSMDELVPYANLIAEGLTDSVMTAHVFNSHIDPEFPATLSRPTITGLLRDRLFYDGVVISDDMQMGAIRKHFGFEEAILQSIEAGVDIIAIANNSLFEPDAATQAIEAVRAAVDAGRISPERIDRSFQRIARLKRHI
ncbi:MAG: glycoside hydrolase family 3 protein [Chloroflexota bacterium]|nr:glycoside hydrolase family 3 protein [Chloroflexota bacterium]